MLRRRLALRRPGRLGVLVVLGVLGLACASTLIAALEERAAAQALRAGGQSRYAHRLTLYDHDGVAISPSDSNPAPYSPRKTCGKCHPYETIAQGWHFHPAPSSGRRGEPWILTDAESGTQLPTSHRGWPDTWSPDALGLTDWEWLAIFGRHYPGGDAGDPPAERRRELRWDIAGPLEIDCLICHAAEGAPYDAAENERQLERGNTKWAATAAFGLAVVQGNAKDVPEDFDPLDGPDPDNPGAQPPKLVYQRSRFDANDRVFFDVTRDPPAERCFFCHSTDVVSAEDTGTQPEPAWLHEGDVHLAAGLTCSDCHTHGIDHRMVRGTPDEVAAGGLAGADRYNCRGCHVGDSASGAARGTHGAPRPIHAGFPALHFERIACTTCHSGPRPATGSGAESRTIAVQTSLAHGLGVASKERTDADLPALRDGYFERDELGRLGPRRAVWPSFWATRTDDGRLTPIPWEEVTEISGAVAKEGAPSKRESDADDTEMTEAPNDEAHPSPRPSDARLRELHRRLSAEKREPVVYIGQGTITEFGGASVESERGDGGLARHEPRTDSERAATRPYLWATAHPVRPARQAWGANGCQECHAEGSVLFTGAVRAPGAPPESPALERPQSWGYDPDLAAAWFGVFEMRSFASALGWIATVVFGLLWIAYTSRAIHAIARRTSGKEPS